MNKTNKNGLSTISAVVITAILVAVIVGAGVYFMAGAPSGEEEKELKNPITIGVVGPMAQLQGQHMWTGATMARDEINALGGIKIGDNWRKIKLVKIDSKGISEPGKAGNRLEEALSRHEIDFLVGGFRTEATLAMQDVAMDHEMLFLGTGSASMPQCDRVGQNYDKYKYWFRITPMNAEGLVGISINHLIMVGKALKLAGVENLRVALVFEKAETGDEMVVAAQQIIPAFGMENTPFAAAPPMEIVSTQRPSDTASDVTAELTAVQNADPNIIYTYLSGPVGIPYARTWGEMDIPACSVGINVEAQKMGFWEATGGYGEYETTLNTYDNVAISPATIPFYEAYTNRMEQFPTYTAGSYDAIYLVAEAMTRQETTNMDVLVEDLEKTGTRENLTQYYRPGLPDGVGTIWQITFNENHDLNWGPNSTAALGTQWIDGELKTVWPYDYPGYGTVEGAVPYTIPPRVLEEWT